MTLSMRRNRVAAVLLVFGLGLAGCGRGKAPPPSMDPEVAVVTLRPQRVVLTTELPGRTAAYRVAEIRPQVNGLIQKRQFTEGSLVKAGELLYAIDPAPYQAAYDTAKANLQCAKETAVKAQAALDASLAALERFEAVLTLAKKNFTRYEELFKKNAISAMDHDQAKVDVNSANSAYRVGKAQVGSDRQSVAVAKAAVAQAEAALEAANINLKYTKITSPIAGRIGRSNVTDGAIATAYQTVPLATVQQLDPIYVDVTQSTMEVLRLKRLLEKGQLKAAEAGQVKILLEDGTSHASPGSFQFCDVTVDPTTGSVVLRIVVPNSDSTLLPGMFVHAVIEEGVREQAILVPQQAVMRDPKGNPFALVVDGEEKVQQRPLVTDRAIGDQWLVSSGVALGDRVIVEGTLKARPGMTVRLVDFKPAGGGTGSERAGAKDTAQTTAP
jgi:membrane fusion protein, multidrug efflux system